MKRKMLFLFFGYFLFFNTLLQAHFVETFGIKGRAVSIPLTGKTLGDFLPTGLVFFSCARYPNQTLALMAGLALYGFYRSDAGKKLLISWGLMKAMEEKSEIDQPNKKQDFEEENEEEMDENIFVFEGNDSFLSKKEELKKVLEAHKEHNAPVPVQENKEELFEENVKELCAEKKEEFFEDNKKQVREENEEKLSIQENELLSNNDSVVDNVETKKIIKKPLKFL